MNTVKASRGFSLPSIMIASVVMLMVLMSAISSVTTTRVGLSDQYYNTMATLAAESGVAMAEACIKAGASAWSDPLRPSSGCDGAADQCSAHECYVVRESNVRTTFSVNPDDVDWENGVPVRFVVRGVTQLLRSSNGSVWREYVQINVWNSSLSKLAGSAGSLPVGTSLDGYWTAPPEGYLFEDGSAVSRILYADLFAVIGTSFGSGDGSTTFNLPDSTGRASVNVSPSETEFDTLGKKVGAVSVALTTAQMPSHYHTGTTGSANPISYRLVHQVGTSRHFGHFPGWSSSPFIERTDNMYNGGHHTHDFTTNTSGSGQGHPNIQPSIVKRSVIKYKKPQGSSSELPAGTSVSGYWTSAPSGFLDEDGTAISRSTYSDLFAAIGTQHGSGNGSTTFNLPDSRGRVGAGLSTADGEFDTIGKKTGAKTVTLTEAQMPSHTHTGTTGPGNAVLYRNVHRQQDQALNNHYVGYAPGSYTERYDAIFPMAYHQHDFTTNSSGSSQAHSNLQPTIVKRAVIKHTPAVFSLELLPVGSSVQGYYTTPPAGYLVENGAAVSRTTYAQLFSVIGTTYGSGDGSTTFNLPDSRGRIAVNLLTGSSDFGTVGQRVGTKSVALTTAQLPAHGHSGTTGIGKARNYRGVSAPGSSTDGNHFAAYQSQTSAYYTDYNDNGWPGSSHTHNFTTNATGGGQSHPNIQPTITKLSIIRY